jgi:hypothetical protein
MNFRPTTIQQTTPRRAARRGFSFTEVLFAVMVLAIGFIMVAAMFPVTIRQQQTTLEETVGASTAKMALAYIQNSDSIKNLRQVGNHWEKCEVFSAGENRGGTNPQNQGVWESLAGNFILPENPRVAWVPLFRRPGGETNVAQVYMFVVQNRNRPVFETVNAVDLPTAKEPKLQGKDIFRIATNGGGLPGSNNPNYATLEPKPVTVRTNKDRGANGTDTIEFLPPTGMGTREVDYREAAAEGGYVVIAEADSDEAYMNGRVYQLGERTSPNGYEFELIPGNDMPDGDRDLPNRGVKAFIMGRALRDPTLPWDPVGNPFEGPTQDTAIYTGFVRIPPVNPPILP